jgi:uncharacterized protein YggE
MKLQQFIRRNTMRTKILSGITILVLMGLILTACSAGTVAAQDTTNPASRTMSVAGEGKAYLTPDTAYINIGVHTEGTAVAEALASNTAQANLVADTLMSLGVDPKDIQTTNFNIYPQQQFGPNGEVTSTKYVVENTVYVTVRDLSKLGNMLDSVVKAGANNINGIQFDSSQKQAAIAEARKAAIADARTQADELATAAGVKLGPIQNINISSSGPIPMYDAKAAAGIGGGGGTVPVSAGQLVITVDVNLTFQIQ